MEKSHKGLFTFLQLPSAKVKAIEIENEPFSPTSPPPQEPRPPPESPPESPGSSVPNSPRAHPSEGKLFFEDGPAISVMAGHHAFIGEHLVFFSFAPDLSLRISSHETNEEERYKTGISALGSELKAIQDQIEIYNQSILALPRNSSSIEACERFEALIAESKARERELDSCFQMELQIEKISTTVVLPCGVMTKTPFHSSGLVWCPVPARAALPTIVSTVVSKTRLIGDGYLYGLGVNPDKKEALRRYQLAADSGDMLAFARSLMLGASAAKALAPGAGVGVDADRADDVKEAAGWFEVVRLGPARPSSTRALITLHHPNTLRMPDPYHRVLPSNPTHCNTPKLSSHRTASVP
jgi:hypothetical protein